MIEQEIFGGMILAPVAIILMIVGMFPYRIGFEAAKSPFKEFFKENSADLKLASKLDNWCQNLMNRKRDVKVHLYARLLGGIRKPMHKRYAWFPYSENEGALCGIIIRVSYFKIFLVTHIAAPSPRAAYNLIKAAKKANFAIAFGVLPDLTSMLVKSGLKKENVTFVTKFNHSLITKEVVTNGRMPSFLVQTAVKIFI